jgi:hypothetical protein
MDELHPGDRHGVDLDSGVLGEAAVEVRRVPGRIGRPDHLRHCVGKLLVALRALATELRELLDRKLLGLEPKLLVLLVQVDEDCDLAPQDLGLERLEHVVDRADLVAPKDVLLILGERGQEDDRDVPRALSFLDQRGGLEAVESRHLDVEQDDREVVAAEQEPQRLVARADADQLLGERLEDSLERDQVLRAVVDEEDGGH